MDQSDWEEGSADSSHLDVVYHLYLYGATTVGALLAKSQRDDAGSCRTRSRQTGIG